MTSRGHEIKPAIQAAIIPPMDALATLLIPLSINLCLAYSNIGSWIAENSISLAKVGANPMYSPSMPLFCLICEKLCNILSDRPTIICCFIISKGFLTKLATIYAHTDENMLPRWDVPTIDLIV